MRLHARLRRLEQQLLAEHGCPACRHRQGLTLLLVARQLPDGTLVSETQKPAPCTVCGQVPEQIIEVILKVVEVPGEVVRAPAGGCP